MIPQTKLSVPCYNLLYLHTDKHPFKFRKITSILPQNPHSNGHEIILPNIQTQTASRVTMGDFFPA